MSTTNQLGELAFENGFDASPHSLWRVLSIRDWKDQGVRNTNWFATEQAAREQAAWISDGRGKVLSVTKYVANESVLSLCRICKDIADSGVLDEATAKELRMEMAKCSSLPGDCDR